jgi:hypothetical protein
VPAGVTVGFEVGCVEEDGRDNDRGEEEEGEEEEENDDDEGKDFDGGVELGEGLGSICGVGEGQIIGDLLVGVVLPCWKRKYAVITSFSAATDHSLENDKLLHPDSEKIEKSSETSRLLKKRLCCSAKRICISFSTSLSRSRCIHRISSFMSMGWSCIAFKQSKMQRMKR